MSATMCPRHRHCAYSGTEPGLCPTCHATNAKCGGRHGQDPGDGSWRRGVAAGRTHPTLRPDQPLHPGEIGSLNLAVRKRPQDPSQESHANVGRFEGDLRDTGEGAVRVEVAMST